MGFGGIQGHGGEERQGQRVCGGNRGAASGTTAVKSEEANKYVEVMEGEVDTPMATKTWSGAWPRERGECAKTACGAHEAVLGRGESREKLMKDGTACAEV